MKKLIIPLIIILFIRCGADEILNNFPITKNNLADINHVLTYGQSLAVGFNEKVITTRPESGGVFSYDDHVLTTPRMKNYPNLYSKLIPMIEKESDNFNWKGYAYRETPTSGTCYELYNQLKQNKGFDGKIVGSCMGEGGYSIAQLSKGTVPYQRILDDVNGGQALADRKEETYKVLAVTWTQGEADYYHKTSKEDYKRMLNQLIEDINTDVKGITGQHEDVSLVMYQTVTINDLSDTPQIALAQYEAAMENKNCYLATPSYHLDFIDDYHITGASTKLLGKYYGYVIGQNLNNKEWNPIHPISHKIKGNYIYLDFYVPVPPLKFEELHGSHLGRRGFKVMLDGKDILFGANIDDSTGTTVKMFCTENPKGAVIQYGFDKYRIPQSKINMGDLRDSQGDTKQTEIDGKIYKMHNWSPIFEYNTKK